MGRQYLTNKTYVTCSFGIKFTKINVRSQQTVDHDKALLATDQDIAEYNFICTKLPFGGISTLFVIGALVGLALFFGPFGLLAAAAIIAAGLLVAGGIGYMICKSSYNQRKWLVSKSDVRIQNKRALTMDSTMSCLFVPGGVITPHTSWASAFMTTAKQNVFNLMDYAGGILCGYGGASMASLGVGGLRAGGMAGAGRALASGFGQGLRSAYAFGKGMSLGGISFTTLNYGFAIVNVYAGYQIATDENRSTGEKARDIAGLIVLELLSVFAGAGGKKTVESAPSASAWDNYSYSDLGTVKPCFLAGTLVKTSKGAIAIETLRTGDKVMGYDFERERIAEKRVTRLFHNWTDRYFEINTNRGEAIYATGRHLFWAEQEERWLPAKEMKAGMALRDMNGKQVIINRTREVKDIEEPTYNLEIENIHNFFVGKHGLLVHNDSKPSKYEDTNKKDVKIYEVYDPRTGKVVYVGQTVHDDVNERFKEHIEEGKKKQNHKKDWKKKYQIREVKAGKWTPYEAAVWEQYYIEKNGGKTALQNRRNEITNEKFDKYKNLHNPC